MERKNAMGVAQVVGGTYLGYQGIKHGLPRTLGIRIENHTTSKANADLIKKQGNILDPLFGGKGGWSEKINSSICVENSTGYVHITGTHPEGHLEKMLEGKKLPKFLRDFVGTIFRKVNNLIYRTVGNLNCKELKTMTCGKTKSKAEVRKWFMSLMKKNIFTNKTKKLYIPGVDSHFTKNFITDCDSDMALKSTKPVKAYTNRFKAMYEGLKEFGLKGIKENKGRVAFGVGLLAVGMYFGVKLVNKGLNKLTGNSEK